MRETRVLVHGAMSLDGFVVGPDHGRHTYEVGPRTKSPETRTAYGGSGTEFVLAHQAKSADDDAAVVSCPAMACGGDRAGRRRWQSTWRCWVST